MSADPPLAIDRAVARAGRYAVASHATAAALRGFDLLEPPDPRDGAPPVHGAAPGRRAIWRSDVRAADVWLTDSAVPVTSPARTAADLALTLPLDQAVLTVDSALRSSGCSAALIRSRCRGRPGAGHASRVLALTDPQSGSLIESCLRMRLHDEGVPAPVTQYPVLDHAGGLILIADFAWPPFRLVVETDGHAYHSGRRRQLVDRYRANALLRAGWHLMRFGYEDVMGRGRHCARLVLVTLRELASGELWQRGASSLRTRRRPPVGHGAAELASLLSRFRRPRVLPPRLINTRAVALSGLSGHFGRARGTCVDL